MTSLRIALLHPADPTLRQPRALARALAAAGHGVTVLSPGRPRRSVEEGVTVLRLPGLPATPLRLRKIGEDLEHVPPAALAVRAGGFDVAHAFSAPAAIAATWGAGGASVLTIAAPVSRAHLADRRLRLAVLERALERSGAVVAPSAEVERSLWRWLGVRARRLDPADAAGHAELYAEVAI